MAESEVLHGIEADRAQLQGLLHGRVEIIDVEGFQQAQNLHIFPASRLDHPRLHQAAQGCELRRQVPFGKRRGLIQSIDLPLDQREVMQRIEDHVLAPVTARMTGNDLAAAADHKKFFAVSVVAVHEFSSSSNKSSTYRGSINAPTCRFAV